MPQGFNSAGINQAIVSRDLTPLVEQAQEFRGQFFIPKAGLGFIAHGVDALLVR